MADNIKSVLCGQCKVAVEGPANPNPDDMLTCPSCGRSDSFENVMASVKAFAIEASSRFLQEGMRDAARGSKAIQFKGKPIPNRRHPFIVQLDL